MLEQRDPVDIESNRQGEEAKNSCQGSEHYRYDTNFSSLHGSFTHSNSAAPEFISKVDQQNCILNHNAGKTHNTHHHHDQWHSHAGDRKSQKYSDYAEENFC